MESDPKHESSSAAEAGEAESLRRELDELRREHRRLRSVVDATHDHVIVMGADLRVRYINPAGCEPFGRAPEELLGRRAEEVVPPDVAEMLNRHVRCALSRGEGVLVEDCIEGPEGPTWVEATLTPYRDEDETQERVMIVARDITRRKEAERELQTSRDDLERAVRERTQALVTINRQLRDEVDQRQRAQAESAGHLELLQTVLDAIPSPVFYKDAEGRYLGCNKAFARYIGRPRGAIVGRTVEEVSHPDLAKQYRAMDEQLIAQPGSQRYEGEVIFADGSRHQVVFSKASFADKQGRTAGLVGTMLDVTETRQATEALRRSELLYRTTIDALHDAMHVVDTDMNVTLVNHAYYDLAHEFGLLDDPVGRPLMETHGFLPDRVWEEYREVFRTGRALITEDVTELNGKTLVSETQKVPISEGNRVVYVITVIRNITERRAAHAALRQSEAKYRFLVENLQEGVWMIDAEAITTFVNPRLAEMLGYAPEEMIGRSLFEFIPERQRKNVRDRIAARKQGVREDHEFVFERRDGRVVYASLSTGPVYDADGNYAGAIAGVMDVTQRVLAEQSLHRAHRQLMFADEEQRRDLARELHDSVGQEMIAMHLATEAVLDLARQEGRQAIADGLSGLSAKCRDLAALVRQVCHGLYPATLEALGLAASLEQLAGTCAPAVEAQVRCDPAFQTRRLGEDVEIALFRIAQEAVTNALHHSQAETIEIELTGFNGGVRLSVRDDGVGFDREAVAASGLGLHTMHERASAVDGELAIRSGPEGTEVEVQVPEAGAG